MNLNIYESMYTCVLLVYYDAALHYKRYLRFFHKLKIEMLSLRNCQMQNPALYHLKSVQINKVLLYKMSLHES